MEETRLDIRLPKIEKQILDDYCEATGRNKTDVLREFIRSLEERMPKQVEQV